MSFLVARLAHRVKLFLDVVLRFSALAVDVDEHSCRFGAVVAVSNISSRFMALMGLGRGRR